MNPCNYSVLNLCQWVIAKERCIWHLLNSIYLFPLALIFLKGVSLVSVGTTFQFKCLQWNGHLMSMMLVLFQRTETIDIDDKNFLWKLAFADTRIAMQDTITRNTLKFTFQFQWMRTYLKEKSLAWYIMQVAFQQNVSFIAQ